MVQIIRTQLGTVHVSYKDEADRQIKAMRAQEIIRPGTSPWANMIVLVKNVQEHFEFVRTIED